MILSYQSPWIKRKGFPTPVCGPLGFGRARRAKEEPQEVLELLWPEQPRANREDMTPDKSYSPVPNQWSNVLTVAPGHECYANPQDQEKGVCQIQGRLDPDRLSSPGELPSSAKEEDAGDPDDAHQYPTNRVAELAQQQYPEGAQNPQSLQARS